MQMQREMVWVYYMTKLQNFMSQSNIITILKQYKPKAGPASNQIFCASKLLL